MPNFYENFSELLHDFVTNFPPQILTQFSKSTLEMNFSHSFCNLVSILTTYKIDQNHLLCLPLHHLLHPLSLFCEQNKKINRKISADSQFSTENPSKICSFLSTCRKFESQIPSSCSSFFPFFC